MTKTLLLFNIGSSEFLVLLIILLGLTAAIVIRKKSKNK